MQCEEKEDFFNTLNAKYYASEKSDRRWLIASQSAN